MTNVRGPLSDSWKFLTQRGAWRPMLTVYIAMLMLSALVLTPLTGVIIRYLVSLSGQAALSDTEIASFILSPGGALAGLVIGALVLTVAILTYAGLLIPARAIDRGEPSSLMATGARLIGSAPALLRLAIRLIIRYLITALPFLAGIGATYWTLLRHNDINFYLAEKPSEFITAVVIAAILLIILGVLLIQITVAWFYALPLVLFRHESSKQAKVHSEQTAKGHRKAITIWLGLWLFGTPLVVSILNAPFTFIAGWLVPNLQDRLPMLALVLGGTMAVTTLISFITAFTSISLLAHRNIRMFADNGLDLPPSETADKSAAPGKLRVPFNEKSLILLGACALFVCAGVCYSWLGRIQMRDDTLIIAHRGASLDAPENTMAAINKAVADGAHWIEIDVQETADGKVVVFHDSDFKRVAGKSLAIWDAQSSDLPGIEIGSWFDPKFSSETTPTLRETLEACRDRSGVLIELKYYGHDEMLEQRVIDIVEDMKMVDQVMIMSLNYQGVQKVRQLRPDWKVGLLSTVALGDITQLDVDFLGLNSAAATKHLIERAHRNEIDVFVWTVNNPIDMSALTSRGVDGLITDAPALARDILKQRTELNPGERLMLELAHIFGRSSSKLEQ